MRRSSPSSLGADERAPLVLRRVLRERLRAAPLGCKAPCGAEMSTCAVCVAASCRCEEGAWRCDVGCADLASFCVYEP